MKYATLILLLLLMPIATAFVIPVNTTITIDWTGLNNSFFLRTESKDYLVYIDPLNQVDSSYTINFTRETGTNQTDFDLVMEKVTNITQVCSNLSAQLGFTGSNYVELQANWSRCNLDKIALMAQVPVFESQIYNLTYNQNTQLFLCTNLKEALQSSLNQCNFVVSNTTDALTREKTSNSNKTIILVIAGIVAAIFAIQYFQKKNKAAPDEMSMLSQS